MVAFKKHEWIFGRWGEWEFTSYFYISLFMIAISIQAVYFIALGQVPLKALLFFASLSYLGHLGFGAGSHRFWSHRSYKARLPLRIFLMILQTLGGQRTIYTWVRDHRLHHKYCETDADPTNAKRGFIFAQLGWFMLKEHPDVKEKEKNIDLSDITSDPVVRFQYEWYFTLHFLIHDAVPVFLAYHFWLPDVYKCVALNFFRWLVEIMVASLANSVAHLWDWKPYEKSIGSADVGWLSMILHGEGWHNFHHVFPYDYRSSDHDTYTFNTTKLFIDLMAFLGLAYDMKTVSQEHIEKRAMRTGDGSYRPKSKGGMQTVKTEALDWVTNSW